MTKELKLSPCGYEPRITTYRKGIVGGELWVCTIQAGSWKIEINGTTPKLAEEMAIEIWNCRTNDQLTAEVEQLRSYNAKLEQENKNFSEKADKALDKWNDALNENEQLKKQIKQLKLTLKFYKEDYQELKQTLNKEN